MSLPAIVPVPIAELSAENIRQAQRAAVVLRESQPALGQQSIFDGLAAEHIDDRPTLHCDDLTEIMRTPTSGSIAFYQERARLRAVAGDFLAASFAREDSYERYCSDQLGLGRVTWLQPDCGADAHRLAEACWKDHRVRRELLAAIRHEGLRYIHPHFGTKAIWELALLLRDASHMRISVIGAPPGLSAFVNDKGEFAALVEELFGPRALPPTEMVWNCALAAEQLREYCRQRAKVAVKLPSSAGGRGNLVFSSQALRGKSLTELRELMHSSLPTLGYDSGSELVVSVWADDVLLAPSAQYWIPPLAQGRPVLEGLFTQTIAGETGSFVGFTVAEIPEPLVEVAHVRCQILALIFQQLGYVGRCSFDLLVVGPTLQTAELQFIECNGRWGGASLPMTLMNRIFGDWQRQPFAVHCLQQLGLHKLAFAQQLTSLGEHAFDARTMRGEYIIINPQQAKQRDEITGIALANDWQAAERRAHMEFPRLVNGMAFATTAANDRNEKHV